jgi:hypothetical protein
MGRPVKKTNFGINSTGKVGGEGLLVAVGGNVVASVTAGTGYFAANAVVVFSAPTLYGGRRATGTVLTTGGAGSGGIANIAITDAGSGYLYAPTANISVSSGAGGHTGGSVTGIQLAPSTFTANAIACNAWVTGGTFGNVADIVKQTGAKTFAVTTGNASVGTTYKCKLVTTTTPHAAGEMVITAKFVDATSFPVAKITDRVVYTAGGVKFPWTVNAPSNVGSTITVTIGN